MEVSIPVLDQNQELWRNRTFSPETVDLFVYMVCGERSCESHSLPVKARGELCGVKRSTDFYIVIKMDVDKNVKQHWPLFVGGEEICFSKRRTL